MIASVSGRRIWAVVPPPVSEVDHDLAAELADRRADRVHADAAARDVARLLRRREARREQQLDRALHVDGVDRLRGDEPALGRLAGDASADRCRGRRRER